MSRLFWLTSYPKCGNTWCRMLIANMRRDRPVDINDLPERGGIASARAWFDNIMLFPSGLLTHEEADRLRPALYRYIATEGAEQESGETETTIDKTRFIKTHDGYTRSADGTPLMGGAGGAAGAILIVRDPRDVAASLANHNRSTIDAAITFMANRDETFCGMRNRQPNQLRQQLLGWSGYAQSWLDQTDIPVHLIRYEDLHADTGGMLRSMLAFAGIDASAAETTQAARFAEFGELQKQESERGFREAPKAKAGKLAGNFFRRGISGGWRDELTEEQVARIELDHAPMMARLGYHPVGHRQERIAS